MVPAKNLEYFSETVIFFDSPDLPEILTEMGIKSKEFEDNRKCRTIPGFVVVSNDGKNFSNCVPFVCVCDSVRQTPVVVDLDKLTLTEESEVIGGQFGENRSHMSGLSEISWPSLEVDLDDFTIVPQKRLKMISKM